LIDADQHRTLAGIARKEGTSISEIVRLAVQEWLEDRQADDLIRKQLDDLRHSKDTSKKSFPDWAESL
jgi:Arc/MetJ-type ribon-helix-helix transcriptional regulator